MKALSKEQVDFFNTQGYLVVPGVLDEETLSKARSGYWNIIKKCNNGEYDEFRVENQLSDYHIFGIERIFSEKIYEPDLIQASINSGVMHYSKQLLGNKDVFILLNRIHCTNKYSYSGPWHRDGDVGQTDHIQSGLFLYDEERFLVVPGSHNRRNEDNETVEMSNHWSRRIMDGEICLKAKAGDLLLFHSSIIHRGTCIGRGNKNRAYVHFRIGTVDFTSNLKSRMPLEYKENNKLSVSDPLWNQAIENCYKVNIPFLPIIKRPPLQRNLRGIAKKTFYRICYYLMSFLPESSEIFSRRPQFTPFLRKYKETK